jgi:hypothetical protein
VQTGGDPPALDETYYRLRALEQVIGQDENWWEAMRSRLLQEPPAIAPVMSV